MVNNYEIELKIQDTSGEADLTNRFKSRFSKPSWYKKRNLKIVFTLNANVNPNIHTFLTSGGIGDNENKIGLQIDGGEIKAVCSNGFASQEILYQVDNIEMQFKAEIDFIPDEVCNIKLYDYVNENLLGEANLINNLPHGLSEAENCFHFRVVTIYDTSQIRSLTVSQVIYSQT